MLKTKALVTAILLICSFNAFALCVYNHSGKDIYFYSDQNWLTAQPQKLAHGNQYCTKEGEAGFGYTIFDGIMDDDDTNLICGALWGNVTVKTIDVVPVGEYATCNIS